MSVMDDSNVYHRCGPEVAAEVKAKATETLSLHDCGLDGALRRWMPILSAGAYRPEVRPTCWPWLCSCVLWPQTNALNKSN